MLFCARYIMTGVCLLLHVRWKLFKKTVIHNPEPDLLQDLKEIEDYHPKLWTDSALSRFFPDARCCPDDPAHGPLGMCPTGSSSLSLGDRRGAAEEVDSWGQHLTGQDIGRWLCGFWIEC